MLVTDVTSGEKTLLYRACVRFTWSMAFATP